MNAKKMVGMMAVMMLATANPSVADVFNMGTGLTSLELVTVGNPGNSPDTRYATPGYGAVDYTYNIGKYEVTTGQYTAFLNAVAGTDTYGLYDTSMWTSNSGCQIQRSGSSGSYTYSVAADYANRPVNCVSWGSAARFVNWLTNGQPTGAQGLLTTEDGSYYLNGAVTDAALMTVTRKANARYVIPTEDEWYKAAYYKNDGATGDYFDYPTSNDAVPSNQLIDPDPGNNATYGHTIGYPYYRTEVGAHENSESPYGTFDQGGNVMEWNEAVISGILRNVRGGAYQTGDAVLQASFRTSDTPATEGTNLGFRVAEVPEPATLSFLAFGCLAMIRQRRM